MLFRLIMSLLRKEIKQVIIPSCIMGISLFLLLQQFGLVHSAFRKGSALMQEVKGVDIWAMDQKERSIEDQKVVMHDALKLVQRIKGVKTAAPLYLGEVDVTFGKKEKRACRLIGLDEETFLGAPECSRFAHKEQLLAEEGVILAESKEMPKVKLGSRLHINHGMAQVVGITKQGKRSEPLLYTSIARAQEWTNRQMEETPFILVKVKDKREVKRIAALIEKKTSFKTFIGNSPIKLLFSSYLKGSHLPPEFSWVIFAGFIGSFLTFVGSLVITIEKFRKSLVIFRTLGASWRVLAECNMIVTMAVALSAWIVALTLHGVWALFYGKGAGIVGLVVGLSLAMTVLFSLSISCLSAFRVKEMTREVL